MNSKPILFAFFSLILAGCHPFEDSDDYPFPDFGEEVRDLFEIGEPDLAPEIEEDLAQPDLVPDASELDLPEYDFGEPIEPDQSPQDILDQGDNVDSTDVSDSPDESDIVEPLNSGPELVPDGSDPPLVVLSVGEFPEAKLYFKASDPDGDELTLLTPVLSDTNSHAQLKSWDTLKSPDEESEYYRYEVVLELAYTGLVSEKVEVELKVSDGEEEASAIQSLSVIELSGSPIEVDCTQEGVSLATKLSSIEVISDFPQPLVDVRIHGHCEEESLELEQMKGISIRGFNQDFTELSEEKAEITISGSSFAITNGPILYLENIKINSGLYIEKALVVLNNMLINNPTGSSIVSQNAFVHFNGLRFTANDAWEVSDHHAIHVKFADWWLPGDGSNPLFVWMLNYLSDDEENPQLYDSWFVGRDLLIEGTYRDLPIYVEEGRFLLNNSKIKVHLEEPFTFLTATTALYAAGLETKLQLSQSTIEVYSELEESSGIYSQEAEVEFWETEFRTSGADTTSATIAIPPKAVIAACTFGRLLPEETTGEEIEYKGLKIISANSESSGPSPELYCELDEDSAGFGCCKDKKVQLYYNQFFSSAALGENVSNTLLFLYKSNTCLQGNGWIAAEVVSEDPDLAPPLTSTGIKSDGSSLILENSAFLLTGSEEAVSLDLNVDNEPGSVAYIINNAFLSAPAQAPDLEEGEVEYKVRIVGIDSFIANNYFGNPHPVLLAISGSEQATLLHNAIASSSLGDYTLGSAFYPIEDEWENAVYGADLELADCLHFSDAAGESTPVGICDDGGIVFCEPEGWQTAIPWVDGQGLERPWVQECEDGSGLAWISIGPFARRGDLKPPPDEVDDVEGFDMPDMPDVMEVHGPDQGVMDGQGETVPMDISFDL